MLAWTGIGGPPSRSVSTQASVGCPDAHLIPAPGNLERVRSATLCLVNLQRHAAGEGALSDDPHLSSAAQAHSDDMVARRYFSHVGSGALLDRLRGAGVRLDSAGGMIGENIAWGSGHLASPARIVSEWMLSPGHRENILNERFERAGIGVGLGAPEAPLAGRAATYTHDFASG